MATRRKTHAKSTGLRVACVLRPPQMLAVFPVAEDVVEARVLVGRHRQHFAFEQRRQEGRERGAAAAGEDDRVDIPIVGPEAIDLLGDARRKLLEGMLDDAREVVALALDLDRALGDAVVEAVELDIDAALLLCFPIHSG